MVLLFVLVALDPYIKLFFLSESGLPQTLNPISKLCLHQLTGLFEAHL